MILKESRCIIFLGMILNKIDPINLLAEKTQVFSSKGEARRMLSSNAISLNKQKMFRSV